MRKKIKKILIILLMFLSIGGIFLLTSNGHKNNNNKSKIIMGTAEGFKPFEYTKEGKIIGFDVDLAQEIANDADNDLVVENFNFDGLITALQAKKVDFIAAGFTKTEERAKNVDYSEPYYSASQMIMVRKNDDKITTKSDLIGKKIGVQISTTGDELVKKMEAERVQFSSVPAIIQDLRNGRIDAAVLDNAPAEIYAKTNSDIRLLPQKLSEEQYAVAVRKGDKKLLEKINNTILRIKSDGTYEEMIKKHFSGELAEKMTTANIFLGQKRYMYLIKGLGMTITLSLVSTIIGTVLGLVVALMRISIWKPFYRFKKSKNKLLSKLAYFNPFEFIAKIYTTVIRGTPLLVQLLIMYYVVFGNYADVSKVLVAAVAFGINSGAYVAEMIRGGFESIDKGQWEASKVLGLNYFQTIFYVTMPQAMRTALPSLIGEFITLLKETSIVGWIGLMDLMRGADNIRFETATAFESLIAAALIYLSLTTIFTRLMGRVERKMKIDDRN